MRTIVRILFLLVLVTGCSGKKESEDKGGTVTLTSKEFAQEFANDKKGAAKKYSNRIVEITGIIIDHERKGTGIEDEPFYSALYLEGLPGEFFEGVKCRTREPKPWTKALPGQTVKLRGKGPDALLGGLLTELDECEILEVSGPGPTSFTADQLAVEHAKGEEARKKLEVKYLVISGEIAKIDFIRTEVAKVTFRTKKAEHPVSAEFDYEHYPETSKLKVGQNLKLVGSYSPQLEEIELISCIILEASR